MLSYVSIIFTAFSAISALPIAEDGHFYGGHYDSDKSLYRVSAGAKTSVSQDSQTHHHLGYAQVGSEGPVGKVEVGLYKVSNYKNNSTSTSKPQDGGTHEVKVMSSGVEVGGFAVMGRASLVDATVNTGRVGINMGVALDTGVAIGKDKMELKFLGVGFKGTRNNIQLCFVLCFGVAW